MNKIRCSKLLLICLLAFAGTETFAQFPLQVKVAEGWLKGTGENGLTIFRGVPFAAPPVAQLRWKAPQSAAAWNGVRSAEHFAPSPMQQGNPAAGKSEDCYYLPMFLFTNLLVHWFQALLPVYKNDLHPLQNPLLSFA